MSKYNNMKSIPIYELSKDEIDIAIKEWAEGNPYLEKLLWTCYEKKIETNGCHAGIEPWISFYINDSKDDIKNMLRAVQQMKNTSISIHPDGGNPYSGPKWDQPVMAIVCNTHNKEKKNEFFNVLNEGLLCPKQNKTFEPDFYTELLDLHDYFKGKDSCLIFRAIHTIEDNYKFVAELAFRESAYKYMNGLFQEAGLKRVPIPDDNPYKAWMIEDKSLENLSVKMKKSINYITNNFSLEPPAEEEEISGFNQMARFKKREFGDTPEGSKMFIEWLIMKREEHHNASKRMCATKVKSTLGLQPNITIKEDKQQER